MVGDVCLVVGRLGEHLRQQGQQVVESASWDEPPDTGGQHASPRMHRCAAGVDELGHVGMADGRLVECVQRDGSHAFEVCWLISERDRHAQLDGCDLLTGHDETVHPQAVGELDDVGSRESPSHFAEVDVRAMHHASSLR